MTSARTPDRAAHIESLLYSAIPRLQTSPASISGYTYTRAQYIFLCVAPHPARVHHESLVLDACKRGRVHADVAYGLQGTL